jgi:4-hydroxybenzoate polyprenyltransferase
MNNLVQGTVDTAPPGGQPGDATRSAQKHSLLQSWWIYQRERFPLATYVPLIAAFSLCTLTYSLLTRGQVHLPSLPAALVAFLTALLFFFQMRIADEFKDAREDAQYRPYRPVPRGLITLRELGVAGLLAGGIQLALALWLSPRLVPLLLLVWAYFGLMSREFFVSSWLKAHPLVYMSSHMVILPLIDLYSTGCDWRVAGVTAPTALIYLLAASFGNGFVVEIGRKIRAPGDEEYGVATYSSLWGRRRAVLAWLSVLAGTSAAAELAALQIGFGQLVAAACTLWLLLSGLVAWRFLAAEGSRAAKAVETMSGLWTLLLYLALGALPLCLRLV